MSRKVSAAEANRSFSALLRDVREGGSYTITSHGRPVARIIPVDANDLVRSVARTTLFKRLRKQPATTVARWTREELYEDE